jgi:hypothetical protein
MEQAFKCPQCGQEFPTQAALSVHVEKEHGVIRTDRPQEEDDPAAMTEFPSDDSLEQIGANELQVPTPDGRR